MKGSRQEMVHLLDQISAGLAGADGGRSQTDEDLDAAAPKAALASRTDRRGSPLYWFGYSSGVGAALWEEEI